MAAREKTERKAAREANTRLSRNTRNEGVELFMECEEEELSPSQIAAHKQAEKEYLDAVQKINSLKSSNGQIYQGHQNSSTSIIVNHTKSSPSPSSSPVVNNLPPTDSSTVVAQNSPLVHVQSSSQAGTTSPSANTPLIGLPRVAVPIPQSPQFIIQNTLPVPAVPPTATAYKLLLDTRTGLILGTVPNDGQAIIATSGTSPTSGSQNPVQQAVTLVPMKENNSNSIAIPQILNVTGSNANLKSKVTVVSSPQPILMCNQQSTKPSSGALGKSQIINIQSISPEHKNVTKENVTSKENSFPGESGEKSLNVSTLVADEDSANTDSRLPSQYPSLTVKVIPQRLASLSVILRKRMDLEKTMKEVLSQSMSSLVKWMFEHGLFHITQRCLVHRYNPMHLVFDVKNEHDRSGGYKWQCSLCQCVLPIQHRSFFDSLGYGFVTMLKVIYCWACNEDVQKVLNQTKVDACFLRSVYALLRTICSTKVKLLIKLGGNDGRPVEASVSMLNVSCSNCTRLFIGCIFERVTGLVALRAFDSRIESKFDDFIQEFVLPSSTITIGRELRISPTLEKEQSYKIIPSPRGSTDPGCLTLNAMAYIQERVIPMLSSVITQLRLETVQSFLNELMWREKFGTNPYNAFNNILLHIKQHYGTGASVVRNNSQPIQMPVVTVVSVDTDKEASATQKKSEPNRTVQLARRKKENRVDDEDTNLNKMISLDDYYYAWQEGLKKSEPVYDKTIYKFKCHVCKKMFDNNIKVMRHLYAHIENSKQRNLDLSDLTQCKYCFREFETPYIMQCHVEDVHLKDSNSLTCRICDRAFKEKSYLINHMFLTHSASEMPYSCEVCHYRCSMYRKIIEHFQQEHSGTNYVQCHHCLRVYNIKCSSVQQIGFTNSFWMHIYKHQTKSLTRKCTACCLTFFSQHEMKQHRIRDHISFKDSPGINKYPVDRSKTILMLEPTKDRGKYPRTRLVKAGGSSNNSSGYGIRETARKHYSSTESLIEIQITDIEGKHCIECKSEIELPDHFLKFVGCSLCRYATNCGKAFANHMIYRHSKIRRDDHSWPVYLPKQMFCICGFSHTRGNSMAFHLVQCGKKSCYPSYDKAKKAIRQYRNEDVPSCINDLASLNSVTSDEALDKEENPEKKEENPNMLNILGLMRKPGGSRYDNTKQTINVIAVSDDITKMNSQSSQRKEEEKMECDGLKTDDTNDESPTTLQHEINGPLTNPPNMVDKESHEETSLNIEEEHSSKRKLSDTENGTNDKVIIIEGVNKHTVESLKKPVRRRKRKWRFGKDWTRRKGIRSRRATTTPKHPKIIRISDMSTDADKLETSQINTEDSSVSADENIDEIKLEDTEPPEANEPDILDKEDQPVLVSCVTSIDNTLKDDEALPPVLDCYADSNTN